MKNEGLLADRKAFSPVVATIILCGVVLIIGISAWSYTYMVSTSLQESYYEGVQEHIDTISEKFTVEHVAYIDGSLHIWVYNYGSVTIEVDVYVWGDMEGSDLSKTLVPRQKFVEIMIPLGDVAEGSELSVEVISKRGNIAHETYVYTVK